MPTNVLSLDPSLVCSSTGASEVVVIGVEPGAGEADVEDEDMALQKSRAPLCTAAGRSDLGSLARSRAVGGVMVSVLKSR